MDNTKEKSKAQYDLDRQTTKISDLSSGKIGKYEVLTGNDVLPEKDLLEKTATIKRFEYSTLGSELKKQTDVVEKTKQMLFMIMKMTEKKLMIDEITLLKILIQS